MSLRYTFSKNERLKHKNDIDALFQNGKAFSILPLKALVTFKNEENQLNPAIKIGFAVAKKKIPHATRRNRVKRLMREAYRLNQYLLKDHLTLTLQLHLMFIYTQKDDNPSFEHINNTVIELIKWIIDKKTIHAS